MAEREVRIPVGGATLGGNLALPSSPIGLVVFAHGTGSSRFSPRNRFVAEALQGNGFGTLLMDLLTADEESVDVRTAHLRFDIGLLASRLVAAVDWLGGREESAALPLGAFGASTGAAAALVAAARRPDAVRAVVSRGGRPDLAGDDLERVRAPTLLIVGGADRVVIGLNEEARERLRAGTEVHLEIVPGATHLFEEPGALEEVADLAGRWFLRHLAGRD
ncbi:MAG: dienelactone hydrolase family protein [Actinomycetota bacterium]|nr:dienelactone hydrolase family protein [Actinomycetota bacterium]